MPKLPQKDNEEALAKGTRRHVGLKDMNSGRDAGKSRTDYARDMQAEMVREDRQAIQKYEKAIAPERISVGQCHTCQHPYRDWIETMLVKGQSYKGIADRVSPPLDRRSISKHYKEHMDLQDTALRRILEEEAALYGRNVEEGVNDIITKRAALELALRRGYDDILNGITTVEPRDLIQIAKVLAEMDSENLATGLDEARNQVQMFIEAIKDVCDADTQDAIVARVKVLRKRAGIDTNLEKVMMDSPPQLPEGDEEDDVVDAVLVDE